MAMKRSHSQSELPSALTAAMIDMTVQHESIAEEKMTIGEWLKNTALASIYTGDDDDDDDDAKSLYFALTEYKDNDEARQALVFIHSIVYAAMSSDCDGRVILASGILQALAASSDATGLIKMAIDTLPSKDAIYFLHIDNRILIDYVLPHDNDVYFQEVYKHIAISISSRVVIAAQAHKCAKLILLLNKGDDGWISQDYVEALEYLHVTPTMFRTISSVIKAKAHKIFSHLYEKWGKNSSKPHPLDHYVFIMLQYHAHSLLSIITMENVDTLVDASYINPLRMEQLSREYTNLTPLTLAIHQGCVECVTAVATSKGVTTRVLGKLPMGYASKIAGVNHVAFERIVKVLQKFTPSIVTRYIL